MDKPKLLISFSGGETSAFMTRLLTAKWGNDYEIIVVFANTGKENEATLEFVNKCDKYWGFNTIWIEAITNPEKGKGCSFKIVDFETANRNGQPFIELIQKYGIPNQSNPHCSWRLKRNAIKAYAKSINWKGYYIAIGIRNDEIDRISPRHKKEKILYPLVTDFPTTKFQIKEFWLSSFFQLDLKDYEGNCDLCWKKSFKKLIQIIREHPEKTEWWDAIEKEYGSFANPDQSGLLRKLNEGGRISFYRKNQTIQDLIKMAGEPILDFEEMTNPNGCEESCEAF